MRTDRQTDGRTDMTIIVTFRDVANAPKNRRHSPNAM